MRKIIGYSINNKFAVTLLTLIVAFAGLYAGVNMKQETIPNIEIPVLTMTTVYPGAAPEEVAEKVTKPLESRIKNLNSVDTVSSTSLENASSIIVQYKFGKNMDKAEEELKNAISGALSLDGVQEPKIGRFSTSSFPVISLSMSADKGTLEDTTKLVEEDLLPALRSIDGVASVEVSGQQAKEMQLTFNTGKMKQLGLSESTVKGIIQASAVKAPLGLFELGKTEKTIVVDGAVSTLDDLKNLSIPVIPSTAGSAGAGTGAGAAAGTSGAPAQAAGSAGQPAGGAGPSAAGTAPTDAGKGAGAAQQAPGGGSASQQQAAAAAGTPSSAAGAASAASQAAAPGAGAAAGLPTVKLGDIADLKLVSVVNSYSRTNGRESIGITITKTTDANTVEVVNAVKDEAKRFTADHPDVNSVIIFDQGKPIKDSVSTMLNKALFGALFAILIIMLFLRNARTTIISVVSIPLSLVIALLVLKQLDLTLNIMTLGAMTVAIGRVVDDSIVVIENNYRRMSLKDEPLSGKALVIDATREMFLPILASTLVTIAVFLPLGLVGGMVGELFLPFAETMVFALLASLLVAVTIVPAMTHFLFRRGLKESQKHVEKLGASARLYRRVLHWSLNHKWAVSLIAVALLASSLLLVKPIGVSFLPEEEQKNVPITYVPGPGTTLDDVNKTALAAESLILKRKENGVTNLQYSIGGTGGINIGTNEKSTLFYVEYDSKTKDFKTEKTKLLQDLKALDPNGSWSTMDTAAGLGNNSLTLNVFGNSMEDVAAATKQISALVGKNPSFEKVANSLSENYAQYTLVADQQKLAKLGLTAGQIAKELSPARTRSVLTNVTVDGKEYQMYVNADKAQYQSIEDIENKTIMSPLGLSVPLKDVVKVEEGTSPNTITRQDGKLYANVTANVVVKDVGKASNDVKKEIDALKLPPGVSVEYAGVTRQINETFSQLGLAMLAAIAIVYLLLVITFGGALTPFVILFSLPFTVIGSLAALYITGETISASVLMGMLMLIGIVVTNAIVLIDRVRNKERDGLGTREALLEGSVTRLRPILMTALATIGALLPLALGFESTSGALISKGLGVTVIGGITSSTLLTLLIVPVVYEALARWRGRNDE